MVGAWFSSGASHHIDHLIRDQLWSLLAIRHVALTSQRVLHLLQVTPSHLFFLTGVFTLLLVSFLAITVFQGRGALLHLLFQVGCCSS